MSHYRVKMLKAYLLNEPDKFQLPETQNRFTQVPQLKPDVSHVSVHFFPNEHAVVLEGENLSFCFEVQLGEQSNALKIKSPDHLTSRIIQFNFPPDKKTRNITILDDSTMKVTLRSHFSNPIRKRVKVNKVFAQLSYYPCTLYSIFWLTRGGPTCVHESLQVQCIVA